METLKDKLDSVEEDEQRKSIHILLEHVGGLGAEPNLFDMIIDTVSGLAGKSYVRKEDLIATIVQVLHLP